MQLKLDDLYKAGPAAGAATSTLPIVMWSLVVLLALALLTGVWAGNRWATGGHAISENAELKGYIGELQVSVQDLREQSAAQAIAYRQATDRLDAIAQERENDRETNRKQAQSIRADLDKLLKARPDLGDTRLGDDVLQHWNKSNARPSPVAAPAQDPVKPKAALPGSSVRARRSSAHAAGQPRPGGRSAPRLSVRDGQADRGSQRADAHRLAVVLHRSQAGGHQGPAVLTRWAAQTRRGRVTHIQRKEAPSA